MKGFRIFPAVAGVAACLLALKAIAYLRTLPEPQRILAPGEAPHIGRVVARARQDHSQIDPDITGSTPAKKEEKPAPEPDPRQAKPAPEPDPRQAKPAPPIAFGAGQPAGAERAILERLGERREQIEGRAREMDTREQLLRAAEKKLDERVSDLKAMEEKLQATAENREQSPAAALKNLVTMYETMKPKEAARVFDRLDLKVLIPVVQKMNPRKMAEVLAAMSPEAAEKLTVALATRGDSTGESAAASANELPRISPPARPPAAPRS